MEESFLDFFEDLPDGRDARYVRYTVKEILLVALCGTISGCEGWEDLELYAQQKMDFLKTLAPFKKGAPSDDTLRRFFRALNPKIFEERFYSWVQSLQLEINLISIDGKTSRGSHDNNRAQQPLHMVSAFASEAGIVLGQTKTNKKSNEITAIPELLEWLDLRGAIVTIDAMGCQKKIAKQVVDKDGDYVLALKDNQGNLCEDVRQYFEDKDNFASYETVEKGHGRIETRKCYVIGKIDWLKKTYKDWAGLKTIVMIESTRELKNKKEFEQRYYISSCAADPKKMLHVIRSHWAIENSLHWTLDMSFGEDQSRIRKDNAPENMVIIRHIALNLLRSVKPKRQTIKRMRKLTGWSNNALLNILQQKSL